jgi:hypothetical protein
VEAKLSSRQGQVELKSLGYSSLLLDPKILSSVRVAVETAALKNKQVHEMSLEAYYARAELAPDSRKPVSSPQ